MTKRSVLTRLVSILGLAILAMSGFRASGQTVGQAGPPSDAEYAHVANTFTFEIDAAFARVAPLFAPEAERQWAGEHWNPVFLYPQPGRDVEHAVFTVRHGGSNSVWVNTVLDVAGGRMQYVAIAADEFAMTVTVLVSAITPVRTKVDVTYLRTALNTSANLHVRALGERDRNSGPEWKRQIDHALGLIKPQE